MPELATTSSPQASRGRRAEPAAVPDFPVREYICAMAAELAQMARWDGDEGLGRLLDAATDAAAQKPIAAKASVRKKRA